VVIATDRQFWNVIRYIHQNPQKHGFTEDFRYWNYSSYGIILTKKPTLLKRGRLLDWFGGKDDYHNLHAEWVSDPQDKRLTGEDFD